MENQPVRIRNPDSKFWKYRWTIKHFLSSKTNMWHRSVPFLVGSYSCHLVIQPSEGYFVLYLEIDPANKPIAEVKLFVIDQMDSTNTVKGASRHQFTVQQHVWGFKCMLPFNELMNRHRGYIVNDTVIVEAYIYINGVTESLTQNSEKVVSDKSDNLMEAHADIVPPSANKNQLYGQVISESSSEAVKPTEELSVDGQGEVVVPLGEKSRRSSETELEKQGKETWTLVEPATPTFGGNIDSGLAKQASKKTRLCESPTAGQLFKDFQHGQSFVDDKFEDIGGFSVLKSQASLYKQIWLNYGHIATSEVLTSSYCGQVAVVSDIMLCITEMHQCPSSELSSEMIDSWEKKIKMAEKLEFNILWLQEHFDRVKNDFYLEEKLKVAIVEKDEAKARLMDADEKLVLANKEVIIAREKLSAVESKISPLILQKKMISEKGKFIFDEFL